MIPIDEQIKHQQNTVKIIEDFDDKESLPKEQAILASLQRLKAIDAVQVPEEPESVRYLRECVVARTRGESTLRYIDTLRDLLRRETADKKLFKDAHQEASDKAFKYYERAEAAEAKLAAIKEQSHD